MTPERYLQSYRQGSYYRSVQSMTDFLEAVAAGEDLWNGGIRSYICFATYSGETDCRTLEGLGWSVGADYGSYGSEDLFIYSPHKTTNNV